MRVRLRPAYSADELARLYVTPHNHTHWPDHRLRVAVTVQVARYLYTAGTVADLSCGDATIARSLAPERLILGDVAPGYAHHGPIEQTIENIPRVELFLCCETLEHLDDPDTVLARIRDKASMLVVSTPDSETTRENPEHYWGWDADGIGDMLRAAGWRPAVQTMVRAHEWGVAYQIWGCR